MAKWTRNHRLAIGAAVLAIGVTLTVISWTYSFAEPTPAWMTSYHDIVERPEGNYNLIVFIVGPIMVLLGGFYVGEQIVLRRRFERLLDTPQKGEFSRRRRDLEDLSERLPEKFAARIQQKESEFQSKRPT